MRAGGLLSVILILCSIPAAALEFTLTPINGGTFRLKDVTGHHFGSTFSNSYTYSNAQVKVALDDAQKLYLAGTVTATGLKPNFAYQIKLAGRNSKLSNVISGSTAAPDDATNERLGYIGRWWRAYPNAANANDADYNANKNDPSYAYSAYLIVAFFLTDAQGNAALHFEGNSSFHVLWRMDQRQPTQNDGPIFNAVIPGTTGNTAYDEGSATPDAPIGLYGEWEPTRALPGKMVMTPGHYACDFILTEESFHDFGIDAGNWTAALGAPIEFDISSGSGQSWATPAPITYPAPLTSAQLNAVSSGVPGTFTYTPPLGTVLPAGTHTLAAQFKPDAATGDVPPPLSVNLVVQKGTPRIYWNPPPNVLANKPLDRDIFAPSADAPGEFTDNFPTTRSLQPGTYTFTVQFVPADQANFSVPEPVTRTIEAVEGLLLASGPYAQPNPAYAGMPVQFSAAGTSRGMDWSWNFGDGSAAADGTPVTHTFATAGEYTVTLTVKGSAGRMESETVSVKVLPMPAGLSGETDSDGDGFSNALELTLGFDPLISTSTPLGGVSGKDALPYSNAKCALKMSSKSAKIHFTASVPVFNGFSAANQRLVLDIDGNVLVFALDARGAAKESDKRASVRVKNAQASLTIDAINFSGPLSGILKPPYVSTSRFAPVTILLGDKLFTSTETFAFKLSGQGMTISNKAK